MRILPDGTVEIKNKRTGDIKVIKPEELGSYGLSYTDYVAQAKAFQQIPGATEKDLINETSTAAQQKIEQGNKSVSGLMDTLKSLYNQPSVTGIRPNPVNKEDLSAGYAGPFGNFPGKILEMKANWNMAPDAKTYKRMKEGFTASLKNMTGDTGILSDQDIARLTAALPDFGDSDETARKAWESIDKILSEKGIKTNFDYNVTSGEDISQQSGMEKFINNPVAKFFGKWGENATTNTQDILGGLRTLPTAFQKAGEEGPLGSLKLLGGAVGGLVKETSDFIPLKVENGNAVFAPEKPFQKIYNEPVSSFMDIAPFTKLPKGTWSKPSVETPAETITNLGKNAPEQVSNTFTKAGARVYAKQFNVPSKIARRIDPVGTSEEVLSYGFKPTDVAGAKEIAEKVTGANGELSKITRAAVGNTTDTINVGNASSEVAKTAERLPMDATADLQTINKILGGGDQAIPLQLSPIDGFDKIKELEGLGYKFKNSSTPLTPNPMNEMRGQLYLDAADNLKDQINALKGTQVAIEALKTPENIAKLKNISPKLAEQFMKAKTWADLRKIQAPFVRLGQMADLTLSSTVSPMSNMSRDMIRAAMTGAGGVAGGPVGAGVGYALAPSLDAVLEPLMNRMQTGVAKGLYGAGNNPLLQRILGK